MLFTDTYITLVEPTIAEFKDRGSKFLAFAFHVYTENEAKEIIKQFKKEHHQAAHHCWALILGADSSFQKSSDDREPSGTAGKPILRAILSKNLTFTLVVVVRYFGGKLLGVSGLIQAYGGAAQLALQNARIVEEILQNKYFVAADYAIHNTIILHLKKHNLKFYPASHNNIEGIIFEVRLNLANLVLLELKEAGFETVFIEN